MNLEASVSCVHQLDSETECLCKFKCQSGSIILGKDSNIFTPTGYRLPYITRKYTP